jgi:cytochrome c oxidase subunit 2
MWLHVKNIGESRWVRVLRLVPVIAAAPSSSVVAQDSIPLTYLRSFGPKADHVTALTWGLLVISVAVILIITALTVAGVILRRSPRSEVAGEAVVQHPGGLSWISIGVGVSTVALLFSMVWTVYTMAAINRPDVDPKLTIHVIGHQWWWEVRYDNDDVSRVFETANEIHIPVGRPVSFELNTVDVIHSFWVPALGDKLDLIPNQTNTTWLQASRPGVYRGQCAEYCGQQHAHMSFLVVAQSESEFQAWWDQQLQPASAASPELTDAENEFILRCGVCHSVRGTRAGGRLGPDLSHLMTRHSIAANTLPNTTAYLSGWIANPQRIKPGNLMPTLDISGPQLESIRKFLESLR